MSVKIFLFFGASKGLHHQILNAKQVPLWTLCFSNTCVNHVWAKTASLCTFLPYLGNGVCHISSDKTRNLPCLHVLQLSIIGFTRSLPQRCLLTLKFKELLLLLLNSFLHLYNHHSNPITTPIFAGTCSGNVESGGREFFNLKLEIISKIGEVCFKKLRRVFMWLVNLE